MLMKIDIQPELKMPNEGWKSLYDEAYKWYDEMIELLFDKEEVVRDLRNSEDRKELYAFDRNNNKMVRFYPDMTDRQYARHDNHEDILTLYKLAFNGNLFVRGKGETHPRMILVSNMEKCEITDQIEGCMEVIIPPKPTGWQVFWNTVSFGALYKEVGKYNEKVALKESAQKLGSGIERIVEIGEKVLEKETKERDEILEDIAIENEIKKEREEIKQRREQEKEQKELVTKRAEEIDYIKENIKNGNEILENIKEEEVNDYLDVMLELHTYFNFQKRVGIMGSGNNKKNRMTEEESDELVRLQAQEYFRKHPDPDIDLKEETEIIYEKSKKELGIIDEKPEEELEEKNPEEELEEELEAKEPEEELEKNPEKEPEKKQEVEKRPYRQAELELKSFEQNFIFDSFSGEVRNHFRKHGYTDEQAGILALAVCATPIISEYHRKHLARMSGDKDYNRHFCEGQNRIDLRNLVNDMFLSDGEKNKDYKHMLQAARNLLGQDIEHFEDDVPKPTPFCMLLINAIRNCNTIYKSSPTMSKEAVMFGYMAGRLADIIRNDPNLGVQMNYLKRFEGEKTVDDDIDEAKGIGRMARIHINGLMSQRALMEASACGTELSKAEKEKHLTRVYMMRMAKNEHELNYNRTVNDPDYVSRQKRIEREAEIWKSPRLQKFGAWRKDMERDYAIVQNLEKTDEERLTIAAKELDEEMGDNLKLVGKEDVIAFNADRYRDAEEYVKYGQDTEFKLSVLANGIVEDEKNRDNMANKIKKSARIQELAKLSTKELAKHVAGANKKDSAVEQTAQSILKDWKKPAKKGGVSEIGKGERQSKMSNGEKHSKNSNGERHSEGGNRHSNGNKDHVAGDEQKGIAIQ